MSDNLPAMQLYLHPTRHEALTASDKALIRWSLDTNPATILAQHSTAPESVFHYLFASSGQLLTYGGITASPDGLLFAHEQLKPYKPWDQDPRVIEWRNFDDFSLARAITLPHTRGNIGSLACSPDGRWFVIENDYRIILLDWQKGEVLSRHANGECSTNSLIFDPTSTFVAGVVFNEGSMLALWRLDPVERFVPRPPRRYWPDQMEVVQDEVMGNKALTLLYVDWNRVGIEWPNRYLAEAPGFVAFSPDSRVVLFSLHSAYHGGEYALVAFEVPSCELLWSVYNIVESFGQAIFSPDGSVLFVPVQGGDLLVYRVEDGALMQRLPTGLSKPVGALAFDHDGKTLWLATEEGLVQYQPQR